MSTELLTISPVAVGTNPQVSNVAFSASDWLEIKNDSPFGITLSIAGISSNSFFLSPFEHNGWPIQQLLQSSQLQIKNLSLVVTPSHYYTDVATENNSPTNICTVNLLSQQEAQTNTYPLYTARMNTTVATIANQVNNVGNPPGSPIAFAQVNGDSNIHGSVYIVNNGVATFGSSANPGQITIQGSGIFAELSAFDLTLFSSNGNDGLIVSSGQSNFINGSTSGTALIVECIRGDGLKIAILTLNNFRNGATPTQFLSMPTGFTTGYHFYAGNISPLEFFSSGIAQFSGILTALAASGGTVAIQTQVNKYSFGDNTNPCDQIGFLGSQASSFSGILIMIGR